MSKILGILGGMGAAAGVRLAQMVVEQCQTKGAKRDEDFPEFMLYNLPFQGMSEKGIENPSLVKQQLVRAVLRMNQAGCRVLVIGCNTAHGFLRELQPHFWGEIVDMVDVACEKAVSPVGLLCSRTARDNRLYESALEVKKKVGLKVNDKNQMIIDQAIRAVIQGDLTSTSTQVIDQIASILCCDGAKTVIIGCTELSCLDIPWPNSHVLIDAASEAIKVALTRLA